MLLLTSTSDALVESGSVSGFLSVVHFLSSVFAVCTSAMIMFLLTRAISTKRMKDREQGLRDRYQEYLADFISIPIKDQLSSMGVSQTISGLTKSDITKSSNRLILLDELYNLHQQLGGYQAEMLKQLFWGWGMQEETISNLKSRSDVLKIKSLDIIMGLDMKDQLTSVAQLIDANHKDVRSQAMACFVALSDGSLEFLKEIPDPLTNWERHKILDAMAKLKEREQIDFDHWAFQLPQHTLFIQELRENLQPQLAHYTAWLEETIKI